MSIHPTKIRTICSVRIRSGRGFITGNLLIRGYRVLDATTFGTLLGALRRPPDGIIFILTAASPRQILPAVVSHYRQFSCQHVPLRPVVSRLNGVTTRRGVTVGGRTLQLISRISRKNLQSTRDLLSRLDLLRPPVATSTI